MEKTLINALIESLEKKSSILDEIIKKNEEQANLLKMEPFSFEAFDVNAEEKSVLIYKLTKLDEGFESTYKKVKEELDNNRKAYALEIKKMQDEIEKITSKSAAIQAGEARNKASLENIFKTERGKLKAQRSNAKALASYSKAMKFSK